MATDNLALTEMTTGQASPEATGNDAIQQVDAILTDLSVIALTDMDETLSSAEVQQFAALEFTGTQTGQHALTIPAGDPHMWLVKNNTVGEYRVEMKYASGETCFIPPGANGYWVVYADGTDVFNLGGYRQFTRDGAWADGVVDFAEDNFLVRSITTTLAITFANFILGRTTWAQITISGAGAPDLTLPAEGVFIEGTFSTVENDVNHVEFIVVSDVEASEKVIVRVHQE